MVIHCHLFRVHGDLFHERPHKLAQFLGVFAIQHDLPQHLGRFGRVYFGLLVGTHPLVFKVHKACFQAPDAIIPLAQAQGDIPQVRCVLSMQFQDGEEVGARLFRHTDLRNDGFSPVRSVLCPAFARLVGLCHHVRHALGGHHLIQQLGQHPFVKQVRAHLSEAATMLAHQTVPAPVVVVDLAAPRAAARLQAGVTQPALEQSGEGEIAPWLAAHVGRFAFFQHLLHPFKVFVTH
nr:hypothetical protein [uncultured Acidovorax sp.]